MSTPYVSVVIPHYRGKRFVGAAVESVLVQQDADTEVIVVDDGSADDSVALLDALAGPRVRIVHHAQNRGIGAARNTGRQHARADFVAFLDQDDLWLPGLVAAHRAVFDADTRGEIGVVFSDLLVLHRSGRVSQPRLRVPERLRELAPEELLASIVQDDFVRLGASIIRRRCLDAAGPFDEAIRGGSDDFDMIARLADVCSFAHVPERLFIRRLHDENYTKAERMMDESLLVLDRIEQRHPGIEHALNVGRYKRLYRRARAFQMAGQPAQAARDYRLTLRTRPWHPRACLGLMLCALGP
ncbi:MAG TPA: glycosyltransferase family 2 protein, partial [Candidatus Krumholzibacteria bacterium]|nr:glycosyltransferase family 2 protein [Candidatus Krumholzibacteria bacterium]